MSESCIYEIVNTSNGKRYIGSAVKFNIRRYNHLSQLRGNKHHSILLQRAFNKCGERSFVFNKLLICSIENLLMYEQICLDNLAHEYNISIDAKSPTKGRKLPPRVISDETRKKISIGNKGKVRTQEMKDKIGAYWRGRKRKPFTDEHRLNLSISHKKPNNGHR